MKCFERLVLSQVQQSVQSIVDPLQFIYQQNRGVDDALLTLLHLVQSHLDTPRSYIRPVFVDFSSAFNTIQPHLMAKKLLKMNLNPHLILWVMSFLTDRPHVDHGGENRTKPGPRKYGCQLTLDPNTANRELSLSEGNRKLMVEVLRPPVFREGAERCIVMVSCYT
ncbi:hypothetical protein SKAU_G00151860 [Synaphobranchus kaupii]|uniref:SPRY-associated domain-containing protein n=1 Tax=Synaphobranchus kaupii TaxID=118154 RepID=A0A9Q1FGV9_SYNKA|nr:hypothetical protein SKAU_G00151860 [Synaphobranchus kaupii]